MENDQLILNHLMKISEDIGGLKSDITNLTATVVNRQESDDELHKEQTSRIQKLEDNHKKVKWMAAGAGAMIAGLWKVVEAMISNGHH